MARNEVRIEVTMRAQLIKALKAAAAEKREHRIEDSSSQLHSPFVPTSEHVLGTVLKMVPQSRNQYFITDFYLT